MHLRLYTFSTCSHCERARALLRERGISYVEQSLDADEGLRTRLARTLGRADMPFALIDGELVGGVDELRRRLEELERGA